MTVLAQVLQGASVPFELVRIGRFRHVQVRGGRPALPQRGEKVLIAHYDRVAGTPGANDNGASVLAMVDYLCRTKGRGAMRVVFTDGEELISGETPAAQGAYALATHWGPVPELFPVVFDMTGIGDTIVLGHLGEQLIRRTRDEPLPTDLDNYGRIRLRARRWLATCGAGDTLEIDTPFSDDLGLFLAGIPATQVSLLPRKQAVAYRRTQRSAPKADAMQKNLPSAWKTMHTPEDCPEALWPASRVLMAEALDKLEAFPLK